jgi:hypothetical protein
MAKPVKELKTWFAGLRPKKQRKVLAFIYGNALLQENLYCGPSPELVGVRKGLFCGPAPDRLSSTSRCPTCGRPL